MTDRLESPDVPAVWGLWHPEKGWHPQKSFCNEIEMNRFLSLNDGSDFVSGYRPIRLVPAGSEVREVVPAWHPKPTCVGAWLTQAGTLCDIDSDNGVLLFSGLWGRAEQVDDFDCWWYGPIPECDLQSKQEPPR